MHSFLDSKVHVANMGPTWVLSAPDGPHVGPMYLAIRVYMVQLVLMRYEGGFSKRIFTSGDHEEGAVYNLCMV